MKIVLIVAAALFGGTCGPESTPVAKPAVVVWHPVASWSGRGNTQTESFVIESGEWRVQWETSNEATAGAGIFQLMVNSADSGNLVTMAADHRGVGRDTSYVRDRPRRYYLAIDSSNLDWSVTVEEPVITY